ncbi:phosphatidylserine decarboxylase 2 [Sugiyamaella lignohabitans]|uniref:Phosphatidylserine decarboxylase proenzyme 2 n=1 Tax=Sugiyamaella lignohabitans TaxID=796027 RepID=A0A167ENH8_9ASCO|nr:phosphatidylserine decarboxylase 2 [Sugiyamaella lignohabitans]ANB14282.1 phosphatidylserine decarboxylase 2 [Sugiyamaella lignohabitans]
MSKIQTEDGNGKQQAKTTPKRKAFRRQKSYELNVYSDIVGMAFMEIVSVSDLPSPKNMARTSFDMDPFVVVSFGKKTFRTPYKRHTLNPVYNEKLLFPIQRNERGYSIRFIVFDNDKLTLNDFVADVELHIKNLLGNVPHQDPDTGLYDAMLKNSVLSEADVGTYVLPLKMKKMEKFSGAVAPRLTVRAKFVPYAALRQQLWRGLAIQYDADDTKTISSVELNAMLDSLGSTLSAQTRANFFERFGKNVETDELTIDEIIMCLEDQIVKDAEDQRRRIETSDSVDSDTSSISSVGTESPPDKEYTAADIIYGDTNSKQSNGNSNSTLVERVIRLSVCPICRQPRLNKRSEIDLVSHVATCASMSWDKLDATVLDRYITSSQAQSRWYTTIVKKLSYGNYKLGANSANILVQDRVTGFIMEEKMSVYVRVGIRLLYKGLSSSRMETKRIRSLLRSLSIKQGVKFDSPSSVSSIVPFIKFHNLDMSESLEPVENFKTFNEFFYRKLKPGVRTLDSPNSDHVAVSPADCRATVFPTVSKAQEVWIKGRPFSVSRLLGDQYPEYVDRFTEGALAIFRLAPQDYHRFHSPVTGILGEPKLIAGEYYTVNPMAIRSALDVFGENVRVLVPIQSEEFGSVMVIAVGAMMVGSTVITAKPGEKINRMDELGYFQFGGSTLVVLFEPGAIVFDRDLEENSFQPLETLVTVGMSVGHTPSTEEWERDDLKSPEDASPEQKERAKRVITGLSG